MKTYQEVEKEIKNKEAEKEETASKTINNDDSSHIDVAIAHMEDDAWSNEFLQLFDIFR